MNDQELMKKLEKLFSKADKRHLFGKCEDSMIGELCCYICSFGEFIQLFNMRADEMKYIHVWLDDQIDDWHSECLVEVGVDVPLHTYLGMTWEEYGLYFKDNIIPQHLIEKYRLNHYS